MAPEEENSEGRRWISRPARSPDGFEPTVKRLSCLSILHLLRGRKTSMTSVGATEPLGGCGQARVRCSRTRCQTDANRCILTQTRRFSPLGSNSSYTMPGREVHRTLIRHASGVKHADRHHKSQVWRVPVLCACRNLPRTRQARRRSRVSALVACVG